MQEHHIRGTNRRSEELGVCCAVTLVYGPLGVAQRTTVAVVSVKPVVEALGDAEELGIAVDHQPARIDPAPTRVADQRTQHLRDPASAPRRVDVPERSLVQQLPSPRERVFEGGECLGGK